MAGVRKWIGSNQPSTRPTTHRRPTVHAESKETHVEQEHDPHSTETIAKQLLDPSISDNEEREYHGCVLLLVVCTLAKTCNICSPPDILINVRC